MGYMFKCKDIPDELRENRRTVLSLLPTFQAHPVWKVIKRCHGKRAFQKAVARWCMQEGKGLQKQ